MPNGAAHHWFYNARGDIHLYMDPLGHATRLVWDEQGDCLQQTDPGGSITRYRYNTRGKSQSVPTRQDTVPASVTTASGG
ncbi:TPA: hypothetical protein ACGRG7_002808 [Morganella morganii]